MSNEPKIYTASKVFRAPMWKELRERYRHKFQFTSSWIDMDLIDDHDPQKCREGWIQNILDVQRSDYLLCYAEKDDPLSGTLVEIGAMIPLGLIVLVGDYDWKTWKHHPKVYLGAPNLEAALLHILFHFKEYH